MSVAKLTLSFPELEFNPVSNRIFPSGIPARDASKSRKYRKNIDFKSSIYNETEEYINENDCLESSLKQAIFGSGSETTSGESPRPTSTLSSTPYPTSSPAPTSCENRRRSGNRCGHDPQNPSFTPPNPKRPKFIQKAISKIYGAYTDRRGLLGLNYHPQGFKVRSERREAYSKVLAVVLEHMDLATLRVGFPTENGFLNYTMEYLATRTGMGLRRVDRAIRGLKKMGFLVISEIRERLQDGSYRSFSAVKTISTTLFDALGLRAWLDKERTKARERLRNKEKEYEKKCTRRGAPMMHRITAKLARMAPTSSARNACTKAQDSQIISATTGAHSVDPVSQYLVELTPKARSLISQLAVDIKVEHSDWSREKIYEKAKRLLPSVYRSPKSVPT